MNSGNNSNSVSTGIGTSEAFRIFLASPGDVPLERKLAREAIAHISSERRFRGRIDIDIVAWDQPGAAVAMEAGLTPQEAIAQGLPTPEACDLAVIVLWSRIGTQLPADFELKEDGSPYLSGTEWEYLNALKGYKTRRKPAVRIYRTLPKHLRWVNMKSPLMNTTCLLRRQGVKNRVMKAGGADVARSLMSAGKMLSLMLNG